MLKAKFVLDLADIFSVISFEKPALFVKSGKKKAQSSADHAPPKPWFPWLVGLGKALAFYNI